jgi:hypothetical protein
MKMTKNHPKPGVETAIMAGQTSSRLSLAEESGKIFPTASVPLGRLEARLISVGRRRLWSLD